MAKYSSRRICRDSEWQNRIVSVRVSIASNRVIARTRWGCFGGMCFLPQGSRSADRWSERSAEAGEPTGAREQVCGPDVILTTGVKGAREISAGRSPLAKQVARAVRARQNHVGGVPANCGSGEQVGRRPRHRAARRFPTLIRNTPRRRRAIALTIKKRPRQMCRGRFFIRCDGR